MNDRQKHLQKALGNAVLFAAKWHHGKYLWCKTPYIMHPIEVMMMFHDEQYAERIVAVCHDVIEDTDATIEDFKREVSDDLEVVNAMMCITHDDRFANYDDYCTNLLENSLLACHVKFYDITHNMRLTRSAYSRPFDSNNKNRNIKIETYQHFWKKLKERLNEENIHVSIK